MSGSSSMVTLGIRRCNLGVYVYGLKQRYIYNSQEASSIVSSAIHRSRSCIRQFRHFEHHGGPWFCSRASTLGRNQYVFSRHSLCTSSLLFAASNIATVRPSLSVFNSGQQSLADHFSNHSPCTGPLQAPTAKHVATVMPAVSCSSGHQSLGDHFSNHNFCPSSLPY